MLVRLTPYPPRNSRQGERFADNFTEIRKFIWSNESLAQKVVPEIKRRRYTPPPKLG
jgi:hypothetical protein